MSHHFRSLAVALVCTVALVGTAAADAINISGVVENATGQPVSGAIVTAIFGTGGSARSARDTTDASGNYEINSTFSGGAGGTGIFQLSAAATGYLTATLPQLVAEPNDGTPDTVAQDFTLQAGQQAAGDSLYVTGTVSDGDGNDVAGASVTVSILSLTGNQTATATTNSQGVYTVAMVNLNAGRSVSILVEATGYADGTAQVNIAEPSDGTADRVTRNFTLTAIVVDTLMVTGQVTDSTNDAGLVGARVIISTGGMSSTVLDTITTGTGGNFAQSIILDQMPLNVAWRVEMAGYVVKSGQRAVANDSAKIGLVELVPFAADDSVTYTVHGRVTDSTSNTSMRNIDVIVSVVFGSELVVRDTVTTNAQGTYTVTSPRVAYQAGNNTVTISATVTGYRPYTAVLTVPTSTTDIVANIALVPATSVLRSYVPVQRSAIGAAKVYSINGRLIGTVDSRRAVNATGAVQSMILRSTDQSVEKVVPAR